MSWTFEVIDTTGQPLGELVDASSRTVQVPMSSIASGSFILDNSNPMNNTLRQMDETLIKAYRNGQLIALGPIVPTYQKRCDDKNKSTQFNWVGVGWRLGLRLIDASKSNSGVTYGTSVAMMDRADIVASIINGLNTSLISGGAVKLADTGIRVDPAVLTQAIRTTSTYVGPWYYKNALQAIQELSSTLDGFDWVIKPVEPVVDSTGLQLGTWTCAAYMGSTQPDQVFEYGDGKLNVASFEENGDASGLLNQAYSLPSGFPDSTSNQSVLVQTDLTALQQRGVLYEDTPQSDFVSDDLRTKLLQQHLAVRKCPRVVISFIPTADQTTGVLPQYGTDYGLGDLVQFRAVEYGVETINAFFRVYEVDFTIDDNGNEQAQPILVSQDVGSAGSTGTSGSGGGVPSHFQA